jgi:3-deoxy-D-manno-octulosonic-acid transferase
MGVLDEAYRRAAVAFVGGSLSPFRGHSPLEAAAAGRPVVMGPHTENCRDAVERLLGAGALETVGSAAELGGAIARRLQAPQETEALGRQARDVVVASTGAAARTVAHLRARQVL